jgi:hypothetical protein
MRGSPREGARTREAREQRLAAGGAQRSPDPHEVCQPIMIGWQRAAHEPPSEPEHARAPPIDN